MSAVTTRGTFRSLRLHNYRTWAIGALISNVGTWTQRTAQDWLVLTRLTPHIARDVGIVMALQFGPQLPLLPVTGFAADHFDRRKWLIATQSAMGLPALGLGLLTVSGLVQLWHVDVFAFALGCVAAFDAPASQTLGALGACHRRGIGLRRGTRRLVLPDQASGSATAPNSWRTAIHSRY